MRIHSNTLTYSDLAWSARIARADYEIDKTGSRSRDHAFTVHLTGESRRSPNRRGKNEPGTKAATWDQWGVFIAMLFSKGPDMVVGSVAYPYYEDSDDFHYRTGNRFVPRPLTDLVNTATEIRAAYWPADAHGDHRFKYNGVPFEQSCTKCSAVQRWHA